MYILKYFITVICGYELLKYTSTRELTLFLLIGALTIILQIFFFNNPLLDSGRYSGFYLNPNVAGFICLIGYGLSFAAQNKKFRLVLQIIFTITGLLTFSRTFIVLWLLTNLISIKIDIKNARVLLYGFVFLTIFVIFSEFLPVRNPRLDQLSSIIKGEKVQTSELNEGSRTETWSLYYDQLFQHPFLGSGYNTFSGYSNISKVGVHNTYLKIWGEGGLLVFVIFLGMYITMIKDALLLFKISPHLIIISLAVILFLTTNHNFFETGYILFLSMWIQAEISRNYKEERLAEIISEEYQKNKSNNLIR
tara:strand:- start:340 stop:1260 length:921 start_codon:yes stop_codon:yes gene_type:complete